MNTGLQSSDHTLRAISVSLIVDLDKVFANGPASFKVIKKREATFALVLKEHYPWGKFSHTIGPDDRGLRLLIRTISSNLHSIGILIHLNTSLR